MTTDVPLLSFNDEFLNLTVNKDERTPGTPYLLRCWHETANGSGDPRSTLRWNLKAHQVVRGKRYVVLSSFDFLIARQEHVRIGGVPYAEIFCYVDYHDFTSWSEGVSEWVLDGTLYRNYELGKVALGIELDGANDGEQKATEPQLNSAAWLAMYLERTERIPLDGRHDVTHAQIAPGRKTDPQGYTVEEILVRAARFRKANYGELWGSRYPYNPTWRIPTAWRTRAAELGKATSAPSDDAAGATWQHFEGGAVRFHPETGAIVHLPVKE